MGYKVQLEFTTKIVFANWIEVPIRVHHQRGICQWIKVPIKVHHQSSISNGIKVPMIIEFSRKQPTLLVAETEEAGALPQVLRSQTSRCVVLDLVVRVVNGALVVFVAFVVHVVLLVLVVLDLAVCVVNRALVALVFLVVFVGIDDAPGETKAIWPQSWIFVAIFILILISG